MVDRGPLYENEKQVYDYRCFIYMHDCDCRFHQNTLSCRSCHAPGNGCYNGRPDSKSQDCGSFSNCIYHNWTNRNTRIYRRWGIHYIFSPTFGYTGLYSRSMDNSKDFICRREENYFCSVNSSLLYTPSAPATIFQPEFCGKNSISILDTAKIGILPFIVPDIIKVLAAQQSQKIIARQNSNFYENLFLPVNEAAMPYLNRRYLAIIIY